MDDLFAHNTFTTTKPNCKRKVMYQKCRQMKNRWIDCNTPQYTCMTNEQLKQFMQISKGKSYYGSMLSMYNIVKD